MQETCCCSSSQALSVLWTQQSFPPSLSAGVKYRKLLLYNSKCLCLCGWLEALSLFYSHMHVQGITARIFKETGAFPKQSGQRCSSPQHQISRNIYFLQKNKKHLLKKICMLFKWLLTQLHKEFQPLSSNAINKDYCPMRLFTEIEMTPFSLFFI